MHSRHAVLSWIFNSVLPVRVRENSSLCFCFLDFFRRKCCLLQKSMRCWGNQCKARHIANDIQGTVNNQHCQDTMTTTRESSLENGLRDAFHLLHFFSFCLQIETCSARQEKWPSVCIIQGSRRKHRIRLDWETWKGLPKGVLKVWTKLDKPTRGLL